MEKSNISLGTGIFTVKDASLILNIPVINIGLWIKKYWENEFSIENSFEYTSGLKNEKVFNFYTLIELLTVSALREVGLSFKKIKIAHNQLSHILNTPYPFAKKHIVTDGKNVWSDELESFLKLDQSEQFHFYEILKPFLKKLEYEEKTQFAARYWPLGVGKAIVVDPLHRFGEPILKGTNISVDVLWNFIQANEPLEYLSKIYDVPISDLESVQDFYSQNAA